MHSSGEIDNAVEWLLRRDRLVVLAGLILLTALSWLYLYHLTLQMGMGSMLADQVGAETMSVSGMIQLAPWTLTDAILMFVMWAIMMIAMMVPSATPMVLLYAHVVRHKSREAEPLAYTSAFFAGYVLIWTGFSAAATALQWGFEQAALLSPMMVSVSPVFGGLVLIVAAVYQWTPLKDACLRRCRSPVWFLSSNWQEGADGALRMGLAHGAYCLGCCWSLMLVLFVGGVMNLLCVAAITIFVLIEKVMPRGRMIGRVGGILLGLAGVFILFNA